jgi:hypothetical protein
MPMLQWTRIRLEGSGLQMRSRIPALSHHTGTWIPTSSDRGAVLLLWHAQVQRNESKKYANVSRVCERELAQVIF